MVSEKNIEALVADAVDKMKDFGLRITQRRVEIVEIFVREDRYISASHVHNIMTQTYPTMSYNTTYRNIYDFVELGILEATEFKQEQFFRIACGIDHHHHHFICRNCGRVLPLTHCPLDFIEDQLAGVTVESHRFEVFGLCEDCQ